ncbi:MAG: hypothetical protein Q4C98_06235 [Capnocytophaga sp.]|nr:hypothetical protein [Capnocytophaga sp.]
MKHWILYFFVGINFLNAQQKVEILEEVVVIGQTPPKYDTQKELKGKKYFTQLTSENIFVVSNHYQKKASKLVGIKFVFDASDLKADAVFIRPVILFENMEEVLTLSKRFPLTETTKEVVFNFSEAPILLEENKNYLIGFEILDENKTRKTIKVMTAVQKGSYSLLKMSPSANWMRVDNDLRGYSLNYTLFFTY